MKKILLIFAALLFVVALFGQVRPDQFPVNTSPDSSNFEVYSQKNGVTQKANLWSLKKYYAPGVNTSPISYVPAATGNTLNLTEFVTTAGDSTYYIDGDGNAFLLWDTNTFQTLSISNDTIFLTDGGFVVIAATYQTIDTLTLVGKTLNASLSNDGEPAQTVDLSGIGENNVGANLGAGAEVFKEKTDSTFHFRTITNGGIISIVEGANEITISGTEVDGDITNELQTIDTFTFDGTTLRLAILNDGQAPQDVDLSGLSDGNGVFDAANNGGTTGISSLTLGSTLTFNPSAYSINVNYTGTGNAFYSSATSTGRGADIRAASGWGAYIQSTNSIGARIDGGLFGASISTTSENPAIVGATNATTTNSFLPMLSMDRTTSGTAGNGIGGGIRINLENDGGGTATAFELRTTLTDVTATTESSDFAIYLLDGGPPQTERFKLNPSGSLVLPGYAAGALNNADSSLYVLAADESGDVHSINKAELGDGGPLTTEQVQDIVGAMIGTQTNISVTYDDPNGELDYIVTGGGTGGGTPEYITYYITDTDPDTLTITAGTPVISAGGTVGINTSDFSEIGSTGRILYQGGAVVCIIDVSTSFRASINNVLTEAWVYKNGSPLDDSEMHRKIGTGADVGNAGLVGMTALSSGDTLDLRYDLGSSGDLYIDNSTFRIAVFGASGETNVGANVGAGVEIYQSKADTTLNFRTLVEGSGISLTQNANDITIATTAPSYTFSNGITETAGAVKLGGALTEATTITGGSYGVTISRNASSPTLTISNANSLGTGVYSSGGLYALRGHMGAADNGVSVYGSHLNGGYPGGFASENATTSGTIGLLRLDRTTSGTAADNIGGTIDFRVEADDGTTYNSNYLWSTWSDATAASRTSKFIISGVDSGTPKTTFGLLGDGHLILNEYAAGAFNSADSALYVLAADETGDIHSVNVGDIAGTTYTFSNGLTESGGAVKFGGTLTEATSVPLATYQLTFSSNDNTGVTVFQNNGSGNPLTGQASGGVGVSGSSSTNSGGYFSSLSGYAANLNINPTSTNSMAYPLSMTRATQGTAAAGIGNGILFAIETDNLGTAVAGEVGVLWSDATFATRTSRFEVDLVSGGTSGRKLAIEGSGKLVLDEYGSNTQTGTAAYNLQVDASGNVIETTVISGGGGDNLGNHTATASLNMDGNQIDSLEILIFNDEDADSGVWSIYEDGLFLAPGDLVIKHSADGEPALIAFQTGDIQLSDYGAGANTGTATYSLSVDANGNIIETAAGSGTDDQTIDVFALDSTLFQLSLESDGEATKELDFSRFGTVAPGTDAVKTATFTAIVGIINLVDCSSAAITVNPPSSPSVDDTFTVSDARANAATNNITVDFSTATQKLYGSVQNYILNADGGAVTFHYVGANTGWVSNK